MASAQATLVYETAVPISFNCASAAAFEKGDFVTLTGAPGNMVVALTSADNDIFGGIVAEEKIANNGTTVSVYRHGYFKVEVGGAGATVGKYGVIGAKNELIDYTTLDDEKGYVFGKFLESGTDGQFVMFELGAA
jgi:hypothetical protein